MPADNPKKFHHPGEGRRRAVPHPRGRQVDPDAVAEIATLLDETPLARDRLIEYLHTIQDTFNGLASRHLVALADLMKISLAEVYEVATFYAHFDVARDDDTDMPALTVRVCDSLPCEMAGADALFDHLAESVPAGVRVVRAPCMGRCDCAPVAEAGHRHVDRADAAAVSKVVTDGDTEPAVPPYPHLKTVPAGRGLRHLPFVRRRAPGL